jgi:hypothetical protein
MNCNATYYVSSLATSQRQLAVRRAQRPNCLPCTASVRRKKADRCARRDTVLITAIRAFDSEWNLPYTEGMISPSSSSARVAKASIF